jgi:Putative quorum-sensing-regulated virulence factor
MMASTITESTHHLICDFGKHKGVPYTRLPVSYLNWMVNAGHHCADVAKAELSRRGTTMPELEVSGHALDRASQYCLDFWMADTNTGATAGISSWLIALATQARVLGKPDLKGRIAYRGMLFAFVEDGCWPVLKTVMREKEHERKE